MMQKACISRLSFPETEAFFNMTQHVEGSRKKTSVAKKIIRIASVALTVLFLLIILFNVICFSMRAFGGNPCPTLFGYGTAVVITSSMEPEITAYDMIVFQEQEQYALRDVVIYVSDDYCITHRIVGLRTAEDGTTMVTTQGDANIAPDEEIPLDCIAGKVVQIIPHIGHLQRFLQQPIGFLILTLIVAALILLPEWVERYRTAKQQKN